jgi:hypothetical protein
MVVRPRRVPSKRYALILVALPVLAGLILGFGRSTSAVGELPPSAFARARVASDAFPPALVSRARSLGFSVEDSRRIAPNLYLLEREGGRLCTAFTRNGGVSGGCSSKGSFFHGEPLTFGIDEAGHPSSPNALVISGVARPEVRRLRAVFGNVTIETTTTADGGFVLTATAEALAQGRPTVLHALNAAGTVVKSYDLPTS